MTTTRLMQSVLEQLESKESDLNSVACVKIAVANKIARRAKKGIPFHGIVLDRHGEVDELADFLEKCSSQIAQLPNQRIQIIYRIQNYKKTGYHWSAIDLQIKNNQLSFYLLDAANSLPEVIHTVKTIFKLCPSAIVRYSSGQIQHDHDNCSTFALDHTFRLAKITDLHEKLEKMECQGQIGNYATYHDFLTHMIKTNPVLAQGEEPEALLLLLKSLKYIPVTRFTAEFGPLVRNTQSVSALDDMFFDMGLMGNDKKDLVTYLLTRIRLVYSDDGELSEINYAVVLKREKIKAKAAVFVKSLDEQAFQGIVAGKNYGAFFEEKPSPVEGAEVAKTGISFSQRG